MTFGRFRPPQTEEKHQTAEEEKANSPRGSARAARKRGERAAEVEKQNAEALLGALYGVLSMIIGNKTRLRWDWRARLLSVGVLLGYVSKKKEVETLTRGPGELEKREGETRRCRAGPMCR